MTCHYHNQNHPTRGRHIALFDSGIGQLSLIPHLKDRIQGAHFTCLGDHAWFPYGDRGSQQIIKRLLEIIPQFVCQTRPDVLILACNTASTQALSQLRARLSIPVIGVVPAIKPAAELSRNGIAGVLATGRTIRSPYTAELITNFAGRCRVILQESRNLARAAEAYYLSSRTPDRKMIIDETKLIARAKPDTVALACTHFPLLQHELSEALPFVRKWTDPGPGVAKQTERILRLTPPLSRTSTDWSLLRSGSGIFLSTDQDFPTCEQHRHLMEKGFRSVAYFHVQEKTPRPPRVCQRGSKARTPEAPASQ